MYPERYRLDTVTRHVLELLERRRPALTRWNKAAEEALSHDAREALGTAGRQFREVADDPAYWTQLERTVLQVALPRYFRLAEAQAALEANGYGVWRRGDVVSRVVYGGVGLGLAAFVWALPELPKFLEPLPLLLFIFGPIVPDVQGALARRRYRRQLLALVREMGEEEAQQTVYRPLGALPEPDAVTLPESPKKERA